MHLRSQTYGRAGSTGSGARPEIVSDGFETFRLSYTFYIVNAWAAARSLAIIYDDLLEIVEMLSSNRFTCPLRATGS